MGEAQRRKELSSPWMSGRKRWPDAVTIPLRDFCALLGAPDISRTEDDLLDLPLCRPRRMRRSCSSISAPSRTCTTTASSSSAPVLPNRVAGQARASPDDGCLPGRRSEVDYHMAQDRAHVLAARIDEFINAQTDIGGDDPTAITSFVMMGSGVRIPLAAPGRGFFLHLR
jgi:hypothetical protein